MAGIGPADFGDDYRSAGLQRLFPDARQLFRRLHILHQQGKDIGLVAVDEVVDEIELLESGFVTGRQDKVKRQFLGAPSVKARKSDPTTLRDCGYVAIGPVVRHQRFVVLVDGGGNGRA